MNDARILVRSAVALAGAGLVLVVLGASTGGGKGVLGAVLGVLLVAAFFTLSVVTVSLAGRWWGPSAMTATALGVYLAKVLALMAIVVAFRDTTAFDTRVFGIAAIAGVLVWTAGQVATLTRRRLHVEPEFEIHPDPNR